MKRKVTFSALITAFLFSILFSVGVVNAGGGVTSNPISDGSPVLRPYNLGDHTFTNYHEFRAHKSGNVQFMINYVPHNTASVLKTQLLDSNYNVLQEGSYTSKYVNTGEIYYLKVTSTGINYQSFISQDYMYSAHYTP